VQRRGYRSSSSGSAVALASIGGIAGHISSAR